MKAILLCAGFGTRLYPLTRTTPKPLLEVGGKPLVEHLLHQMAESGHIDDVLVVSNRRFFSQFDAWAGRMRASFPRISFRVLDDGATDNANRRGAVADLAWVVAQNEIREPVLVAAGDNLFRFDLRSFLEDYLARPRNLVLVHRESDPERLRRTGVAEIGEEGRLLRLWEKPAEPSAEWACTALYVLESSALSVLRRFMGSNHSTDALGHFIAWLAQNEEVYTHPMEGRRLDVGDEASYRRADAWLREDDSA